MSSNETASVPGTGVELSNGELQASPLADAGSPAEPDLGSLLAGMGDLIGSLKKKKAELARRVSPISGRTRKTNQKTRRKSPTRKSPTRKVSPRVSAEAQSDSVAASSSPSQTGSNAAQVNSKEDAEEEDDLLNDPALLRARALCAAMGTLTPSVNHSVDAPATATNASATAGSPGTVSRSVLSPSRSSAATRAPESLISKGLRKSKQQRANVTQVKIRSKRAGKGGLSPTGDARGLNAGERDEESERLIALARSLCADDGPKRAAKRPPVINNFGGRGRAHRKPKPKRNGATLTTPSSRRKDIEAAAATKTLQQLSVETVLNSSPGQEASDATAVDDAHAQLAVEVAQTQQATTDTSAQKNISKQYLLEKRRRERQAAVSNPETAQQREEKAAAQARHLEDYRAKLKAKIAREKRLAEAARKKRVQEEEEAALQRAALAEEQRQRDLRNVEVSGPLSVCSVPIRYDRPHLFLAIHFM